MEASAISFRYSTTDVFYDSRMAMSNAQAEAVMAGALRVGDLEATLFAAHVPIFPDTPPRGLTPSLGFLD